MSDPAFVPCPPPARPVHRPLVKLPAGACDTHVHVIGPFDRYPLSPSRGYTPTPCSLIEYQAAMQVLGISRAVLVQPSVYGIDNAAMLDALRQGGAAFRGIAVVPPEIDDRKLEHQHALGVRGVRINVLNRGGLALEAAIPLARKIAKLGWHLQIFLDIEQIDDLAGTIRGLDVPIVIDHLGFARPRLGKLSTGFRNLIRLVELGRCWIKISAPYRLSQEDRPPYHDVVPLVRSLVSANSSCVLWATDWPHTDHYKQMPNDADMVDLLADWVPNEATRKQILVDNPTALYWRE